MSGVSVVKEGIGSRRLVVNNLDNRVAFCCIVVSSKASTQGAVDPMTVSNLFRSLEKRFVKMTGCHLKLDSASMTLAST